MYCDVGKTTQSVIRSIILLLHTALLEAFALKASFMNKIRYIDCAFAPPAWLWQPLQWPVTGEPSCWNSWQPLRLTSTSHALARCRHDSRKSGMQSRTERTKPAPEQRGKESVWGTGGRLKFQRWPGKVLPRKVGFWIKSPRQELPVQLAWTTCFKQREEPSAEPRGRTIPDGF